MPVYLLSWIAAGHNEKAKMIITVIVDIRNFVSKSVDLGIKNLFLYKDCGSLMCYA